MFRMVGHPEAKRSLSELSSFGSNPLGSHLCEMATKRSLRILTQVRVSLQHIRSKDSVSRTRYGALQDRVCSDRFEAQAVASSLRGGIIVRALWATKAGLDKLTFDMAQTLNLMVLPLSRYGRDQLAGNEQGRFFPSFRMGQDTRSAGNPTVFGSRDRESLYRFKPSCRRADAW